VPKKQTAAAAAEPAAVGESRHTLRTLIERLHPAVLDVAAAPAGLDIAVGDPLIVDPAEPAAVPAGAVALAVGVDSDRVRVALLRRLGECAAAVVVIKQHGAVADTVLAAAADAGVAVLVAPPALSWGQLYTLLLTAGSAAPSVASQVTEAPLGDLFALANAIAAAVGGATTIEDATNRVLAYSNLGHPIDPARQETILGRQVPSGWIQRLQEAGVFRRLWQTDEVVRIADFADEDTAYLSRIAVAVRAGGELLGSVWVIEGDQPLGAEAERTLRDAGQIAALHLLRHRTATDVDRQRRAEALLALLAGTDRGEVAADVLGIAPDRPSAVIAFAVRDAGQTAGGSTGGASAVVAAQRVADVAAVYCESYRRQAACAASGERVYVLVPVDSDLDATPAVGLADAVVERAGQALRLRLQAGVGSAVSALEGVARARREADEVLDVLTEMPEQRVATIGGLRAKVILHRLRDLAARDRDLVAGHVAALAEQDAAKGTAWVQTLRAYFDAFGDMASAASMVNVHPNTFRYRLRRITEVFGLDLDDPDERLVAELQLRFLRQDPP
jgi:DNA-binding PucR family transcriptional regulator